MIEQIQEIAKSNHQRVVEIRRHIHRHPELSFEEYETTTYVKKILRELEIEILDSGMETGVVGLIRGNMDSSDACLALRADLDALPIQEENQVDYKSVKNGLMHACGHDVHTASILGAAMILNQLRDEFPGIVKLIFQPGEEKLPGGASQMIDAGVLENPKVDVILGHHVHPPLESGKLGFHAGEYMGSADEIYLSVKGKGGHAALPHTTVDPVSISAQIITQLQQLLTRRSNPITPSVLSFGKIQSLGGATNVIPDEVYIEGTFRTMNESWRFEFHKMMQSAAESIAQSMGGSCDLKIVVGYPVLLNDPPLTERVAEYCRAMLGDENIRPLEKRLTAEDFAFYSQHIPACFFRIGTGNIELGISAPVHSNRFDIDENSLISSTSAMAYAAMMELRRISYVKKV